MNRQGSWPLTNSCPIPLSSPPRLTATIRLVAEASTTLSNCAARDGVDRGKFAVAVDYQLCSPRPGRLKAVPRGGQRTSTYETSMALLP